ncbi:hypothetical protein [Pseudoalteromonas sp. SIMBA_162]|uniref:hypothetical protein n=1 Tax=Pseudoalteromonas sp. SIMBA_162 TaxID=3080867 RepID=UPI003979CC40
MSLLVCKKCNSTITVRIKTPNARERSYVCPVCGTSINTFKIINYVIGLTVLFTLWVISFFSHHIIEGNFKFNQENQLSLIAVIVLVTFIGYVTYRRSKEVEKSKKWVLFGSIAGLLLLNEIHTAALRVWGL